MSKIYNSLPSSTLPTGLDYAQPVELPEVLHWDDTAFQAMVDFKYIKAPTISPDDGIDEALLSIKNTPFHVLLVVNKDEQVLGIITGEDLLGEKPLKAIQHRQLKRSDIVVRMVMTSQPEILALDVADLKHAKVGHIVETLHAHKQHYALVIGNETSHPPIIRGLFSLTLLSKQLGQDVVSDISQAHSLAELQHDLRFQDKF